jgi:hypothetical protein
MARKEKTIHYLYKITCNVTERWYIGMHSTHNLDDGYMGSGVVLRRSIRKYGVDNHTKEIIDFFVTKELMTEAEKKAITTEMVNDRMCMNLVYGGTGWNEKHNDAFREKLKNDSEFKKEFSKKRTDALNKQYANGVRQKISVKNWDGCKHSEETKLKMSESSKGMGVGEENSQYGTCWVTKDNSNKKIKKENLETYLKEGWVKGRK